jgi:hypothetical protein
MEEPDFIDIEATVEVMPSAVPDHTVRRHHKYGMSKLNYLAACAGFDSADKESEAADEGTRLHEIMDQIAVVVAADLPHYSGGTGQRRFLSTFRELVISGEVIADENDTYLLEYCCTEIDKWLDRGANFKLVNEIKVFVRNPDGTELNHGHLDLALFFDAKRAVVFDYKFGWRKVPPAEDNLQGLGYALGLFDAYVTLDLVGSVFIQPKLAHVSEAIFKRQDLYDNYLRIKTVIEAAESPDKTLCPGHYCDYCKHNGNCTALVKNGYRALAKYEPIPFPDTFDGLQITSPEQVALALYVVDRLDKLVSSNDLRQKALALAKANGGTFIAPLSPTENIVIEAKSRKAARSAEKPALIAEVLADVLTPEQVLACCDPSITKLEEVFADTLYDKRKKESDAILAGAEVRASAVLRSVAKDDPQAEADACAEEARRIRAEAKAHAKEHRVTKAYAKQILEDSLRSEGLLNRPDGVIEFAKLRVEPVSKPQLTEQAA